MSDAEPALVAVVTIAHGRHEHLRHQVRSLARHPPDLFVLVAMGDRDLAAVLDAEPRPARHVAVREVDVEDGDLPLAAARNLGAVTAMEAGMGVLVFLDVDCVASEGLWSRYASVAAGIDGSGPPVVLAGEVGYLPEGVDLEDGDLTRIAALAAAHPARPRPRPVEVLPAEDLDLFWSLSFAMRADHWRAVGGFDEAYVGYGAEDTDFGQRVMRSGGSMLWVGGAAAYHQHHGSTTPPLQHVKSIVRNANVFHGKWGWFPMIGWLEQMRDLGLVEQGGAAGAWRLSGGGTTHPVPPPR